MSPKINNFKSFTIYDDKVSDEFAEQLVDYLVTIPNLCEAFKNRLFVQPKPDDIFILALTALKDTGDIDCLVRALKWQQVTIDNLRIETDIHAKSLLKLDALRQQCARLQYELTNLRNRNAELIKALKEQHCRIPKAREYEKKRKNQN